MKRRPRATRRAMRRRLQRHPTRWASLVICVKVSKLIILVGTGTDEVPSEIEGGARTVQLYDEDSNRHPRFMNRRNHRDSPLLRGPPVDRCATDARQCATRERRRTERISCDDTFERNARVGVDARCDGAVRRRCATTIYDARCG